MDRHVYQGRLERWNEARAFGFIKTRNVNRDIFVHLSAFSDKRYRPRPGDTISYQVEHQASGKSRAINATIVRAATKSTPARERPRSRPDRPLPPTPPRGLPISALALVMLAIIGLGTYNSLTAPSAPTTLISNSELPRALTSRAAQFRCEGKAYCSQMRSCAEATFYQHNCPNTRMDGDGDGVPCESQWCR